MLNQVKIKNIVTKSKEAKQFEELQHLLSGDLYLKVEALNNALVANKENLSKSQHFVDEKLADIKLLIQKIDDNENNLKNEFTSFSENQKLLQNKTERYKSEINKVYLQLQEIINQINNQEKFVGKVNLLVDDKILDLKTNFKENFGTEVTETIKYQIQNSQDDFVEAIYPIMGKMIRKYVGSFMIELKDSIDKQINETYSFSAIWKKIRGVKKSDEVISKLLKAEIEEIFLIDKNTSLEIGNYSKNNITDSDLITSMFSALKQFAESVIDKKEIELEAISFDNYILMVVDGYKHYYCCVLSGVVSNDFKNKLNDKLSHFSSTKVPKNIEEINSDLNLELSNNLKKVINEFEEDHK